MLSFRTMKSLPLHRRLAALGVAVVVGVLLVGTAGQLPAWGEVAPVAFAGALLGLWVVGTVAWQP